MNINISHKIPKAEGTEPVRNQGCIKWATNSEHIQTPTLINIQITQTKSMNIKKNTKAYRDDTWTFFLQNSSPTYSFSSSTEALPLNIQLAPPECLSKLPKTPSLQLLT